MKKFIMAIILMLATSLIFVGCSNDDDDPDTTSTVTPTSITVQNITVTHWPNRDPNGLTWDICFGTNCVRPDIYPSVKYGSTTILDLVNNPKEDANVGTSYSFAVNNAVMTEPENEHLFRLHDEDGAVDDLMGQVLIAPFDAVAGRPNPIIISGGGITMELDVTYQD